MLFIILLIFFLCFPIIIRIILFIHSKSNNTFEQKNPNTEYLDTDNIFNPRDENTYKYAKDNVFAVVDGVKLFEEWESFDGMHKKYLSEKDLVEDIENLWDSYNNKLNISKQEFINKHLKTFVILCSDLSIKKSDLTIKDYNFSIAQKEMMKYLSQEEKEKLTDIILYHFTNKLQKYKLKQEIFDNLAGKIDNYLFADLCYCNDNETEQEIMEEYYSGFDTIESENEVNEIIDNEYLNLYPELKSSIKEYLLSLI